MHATLYRKHSVRSMFVARFVACSFFEHRFYTIERNVSGRSKRIHFKYVHYLRVGAIKLQIKRWRRQKERKTVFCRETHKELDAHTLPTPSSQRIRSYQKQSKKIAYFFSFNGGYAFRCDFHRVKFICRWINDFILDFNFKLCRISLSLVMTQIDQFGVVRHGAHI